MKFIIDTLRRQLNRSILTAYGCWAALSLLLVLGTFTSLDQAENTERSAVMDRAEAGAGALEQTMLRVFEAVDTLQDLAQTRLRLISAGKAAAADTIAQEMCNIAAEKPFGIVQIIVVDPHGTRDPWAEHTEDCIDDGQTGIPAIAVDAGAAHDQMAVDGQLIDMAPRWVVHGDVRDRRLSLTVGPPRFDAATQRWRVHVSRALTLKDDDDRPKLAAIAIVSLDPIVLSDLIGRQTNNDGESNIVQSRRTGAIIARSAQADLRVDTGDPDQQLLGLGLGFGLRVAPTDPVLQRAIGRADAGETLTQFRDREHGVDRLVGFRALNGVPLVVSQSFDTDDALGDFYKLRSIVLSVIVALVIGALVATRLFLANFLLRQRLGEQAHRDPLTGLHNRRYFTDVMSQRMSSAIRQGDMAVVLLVDLDGFKQVNDTRGHPVGDGLLRDVARRLHQCVGRDDTVIRLGGDEFAIVRLGRTQRRDVTALARFVVNELGETYEVDDYHVRISASVGVAMPPEGGEDLNDLLRSADIALYFVKSEGGSAYQLFDPAMENTVRTRRALEIDLREALGRRELEIYYQPLVQLDPHRVSGFEALLRWHHPTLGMVMPSRFIPVAEETGLIAPIGEWVLRQACLEAAHWPGQTRVAVNLSPIQFERSDIVDIVGAALRESHLAPERLELEITEGVVMRDTGDVLATMRRLRALGVRLALDDFGTGYSSLSYLRSFPFDKVKIDGSFLSDLAGDGGTIIRAVLGLCRHLNLDMLVEGVETEDQLDWLRREGCTEVQGHFFSPPRPATGVAEIIGEVASRAVRHLPAEA